MVSRAPLCIGRSALALGRGVGRTCLMPLGAAQEGECVRLCVTTIAAAARSRAKRSWRGSHHRAPLPTPLASSASPEALRRRKRAEEALGRQPRQPLPLGTTEKRKKGGQTRRQGARLTGLAAGLPPLGCWGRGRRSLLNPPGFLTWPLGCSLRYQRYAPNVMLRERREEKPH